MKTLLIAAILLITSSLLFSQEKTLLTGEIEHGGFGGPVVKFTSINEQFGVLVGGRGGWIINHTFSLGIGGYGLTNGVNWSVRTLDEVLPKLMMGYGGFEMEFIINSDEVIHFTLQALIGGGAVTYNDKDYRHEFRWDNWENTDEFFIAEPGANVILNITSFFRLGAGASYRFVSGVELPGLENSDIAGFSGVLTFKFGSF